MQFRFALLAASALAAVPLLAARPAAAQPVTGIYIGGGAGGNFGGYDQTDTRLRATSARGQGIGGSGRLLLDPGFVGVLSIGYGFGNGFRAEVEGNYRQNDVAKFKGFGPSQFGRDNAGGIQRTYGAMANVFYDFDFASFGLPPSLIQPYVGVGAGYAWTDWTRVRSVNTAGTRTFSDDQDGAFAYQGIAGFAVPLTRFGLPGLSLTAEYRYFATNPVKLNTAVVASNGGLLSTGTLRERNENHSALLGLRYALFQPAPPPPPVPVPPPAPVAAARTYLVFFDWNRSDLTGRAREIIGEAARNARSTATTRIEVAGHADRSGTDAYNQGLSRRRAEVVAAQLVRDGIPRNEIGIQAFGESRPLVPTADGVREPQNRRVEIVLR